MQRTKEDKDFNLSAETYDNIYSFLSLKEVVNLQNTSKAAHESINPGLQNRNEYKLVTSVNSIIKFNKRSSTICRWFGGIIGVLSLSGGCTYLITQLPVLASRWEYLAHEWMYGICGDDNPNIFIPQNITQCGQRPVLAKTSSSDCNYLYKLLGQECAFYALDITSIILLGGLSIGLLHCAFKKKSCYMAVVDELPKDLINEFKTQETKGTDELTDFKTSRSNPLDRPYKTAVIDLKNIKSFNTQPFFRRRPPAETPESHTIIDIQGNLTQPLLSTFTYQYTQND